MIRKNTPYSSLFQSIAIKVKRKADEQTSHLGLNAQQAKMIGYIHEHQEKGLIQKEVAEHFDRRGATITSMLQGLEKHGYIERKIQSDNERQKKLYVLPKGEELIEQFYTTFSQVEEELTQALTPQERETLLSLLIKVNQNL